MVAYSIEVLSAILNEVPSINGRPTFKALWDLMRLFPPVLQTIQHSDHPDEGMAGIMIEAAAYSLVSARPWLVLDRVGGSLRSRAGVSMRQTRGRRKESGQRRSSTKSTTITLRHVFAECLIESSRLTSMREELLWEEADSDPDLP